METDCPPSSVDSAGPVTTVEIRIRTLDSANYTLRVDKDVPVPALKDQLASVVGVPSQDQRLICRGRVLKDDQLLSYYNVEDGHTLHLVARPPGIPAEETPATHEPAAGAPRRATISHSVVLGTINIPETGEGGVMPELNRILSAVLGGGGVASAENRRGVALMQVSSSGIPASNAPAAATSTTIPSETRRQVPAESLHFRNVEVVPDALTTIGQYLSRMEQSFSENGYGSLDASFLSSLGSRQQQSNAGVSSTAVGVAAASRPLPTPASLGATISRVQQLLHGQASSALTYLASQLENEPNVSDSNSRADLQSIAVWSGNIMQQLGALLMELGRTTLTLRLGTTPAQAVVNSGPAIFVSPTGPNPMMVQPLPFQTGLPLGGILGGASSLQAEATAPASVLSARTVGISQTPGESTTGRRFLPLFGSIALHHAAGGGDSASPAAEEGNANAAAAAGVGSDGPRQAAQSEQEGSDSLGLVVQENGTVRLLPVRTRSASLFRGLRAAGSEAVSVPVLGIRAQVHAHPWTQAVMQASEGQRPVGIAVTIPVDVTTSRVNGPSGAPADAGNDSTTSREAQVVVDGREASTQNCSEQTPAAAEGERMDTQASEDGDERSSRKRAEQEDGAESCMSTSPPESEHPHSSQGGAKRQKVNK